METRCAGTSGAYAEWAIDNLILDSSLVAHVGGHQSKGEFDLDLSLVACHRPQSALVAFILLYAVWIGGRWTSVLAKFSSFSVLWCWRRPSRISLKSTSVLPRVQRHLNDLSRDGVWLVVWRVQPERFLSLDTTFCHTLSEEEGMRPLSVFSAGKKLSLSNHGGKTPDKRCLRRPCGTVKCSVSPFSLNWFLVDLGELISVVVPTALCFCYRDEYELEQTVQDALRSCAARGQFSLCSLQLLRLALFFTFLVPTCFQFLQMTMYSWPTPDPQLLLMNSCSW